MVAHTIWQPKKQALASAQTVPAQTVLRGPHAAA